MMSRSWRTKDGIFFGPAPGTKNFEKLLVIIFTSFWIVGMAFAIIGGIWLHSDNEFLNTAQQIQGTIIEFSYDSDGDTKPTVKYIVNGEIYTHELNYYSSSMKIGDTVDLFYDADYPQNVRSSFSGGEVFVCVGSVFAIFGFSGTVVIFAQKRSKKKCLDEGEPIRARVTKIKLLKNVAVNGVSPYRVYCDSSAVPEMRGKPFVSRNIYVRVPQDLVGTYLTVYVDSKKPQRYYVDIDTESLKINNI